MVSIMYVGYSTDGTLIEPNSPTARAMGIVWDNIKETGMFTIETYQPGKSYRVVASSKSKTSILFKASLQRIIGDARRMRIKRPDGTVLLKRVYA